MFRAVFKQEGGVAQMVERSLSMREVPGSIPGASNLPFFFLFNFVFSNRTDFVAISLLNDLILVSKKFLKFFE